VVVSKKKRVGNFLADTPPHPTMQNASVDSDGAPVAFDSVTEYTCSYSVQAWNDHTKEQQGDEPCDISNCWNCFRPLTPKGYFPWVDAAVWEHDDNFKAMLRTYAAHLPLPELTFGCPVVLDTEGTIKLKGSFCSLQCVRRHAEDNQAYNFSDVQAMITRMALEAKVPLAQMHTAPPRTVLRCFGGPVEFAAYEEIGRTSKVSPIDSDLFVRRKMDYQFVENDSVHQVESRYSRYLRGNSTPSSSGASVGGGPASGATEGTSKKTSSMASFLFE
jgi:hypothetical protein